MRISLYSTGESRRAPRITWKEGASHYRADFYDATGDTTTFFYDDEWFDAFVQATIAARASRLGRPLAGSSSTNAFLNAATAYVALMTSDMRNASDKEEIGRRIDRAREAMYAAFKAMDRQI